MTTSLEAMAREAGAFTPGTNRNYWAVTEPALARFAALVRAQALEDAALAIEDARSRWAGSAGSYALCVAAITIRDLSTAEVATCKPAT